MGNWQNKASNPGLQTFQEPSDCCDFYVLYASGGGGGDQNRIQFPFPLLPQTQGKWPLRNIQEEQYGKSQPYFRLQC